VDEVLTWQVWQRRYLDPTFGGAVIPGRRNVLLSAADLTGYAFIDQPRRYSPVVSALRYVNRIGLEWRTDYDPLRQHFVNSGLTADYRGENFLISLGHNQVRNDPVLAPSSNQFRGSFQIGKENRRGWNAATSVYYDYKKQLMQYATTQETYNTDCCGFSFQYRRLNFGTRNDHVYLAAFAVANIGTFGNLKRQERIIY
jgi:LPS-assembly protein